MHVIIVGRLRTHEILDLNYQCFRAGFINESFNKSALKESAYCIFVIFLTTVLSLHHWDTDLHNANNMRGPVKNSFWLFSYCYNGEHGMVYGLLVSWIGFQRTCAKRTVPEQLLLVVFPLSQIVWLPPHVVTNWASRTSYLLSPVGDDNTLGNTRPAIHAI